MLVETSDGYINILDYFFENLCKIKLAIKTNVRIRCTCPTCLRTSVPKINNGMPEIISPKPVKNCVIPDVVNKEIFLSR